MGNSISTFETNKNSSTLNKHTYSKSSSSGNNQQQSTSTFDRQSQKNKKGFQGGGENSRVLFLLYLIHRTWSIMVETIDPKTKR